ncbi:MAG: TrmH family RNA methyltransferase [Pirellulales bacterium]
MNHRTITSPHNPRVKDAARLRTSRQRKKQQHVLVDGVREIARALDGQARLVEVFVCESLCRGAESRGLLERLGALDGSLWHVTPEVFEKLAFGQRAEGVVAVVETPERSLDALCVADGGLVAVLCGLEKPGNVGAILRSADGAGVAAVIVADAGTDLFNPNCIRASLGTVFTQQVAAAAAGDTLAWLRERGFKMFAARLDATNDYTAVDYRGNTAILLGSEAAGLGAAWHADDVAPIKLPMRGSADSLNVSATAAVLFYEALRQRSPGSHIESWAD